MFLAAVAVGEPSIHIPDQMQPPAQRAGTHLRYDSTVDCLEDPSVVVAYHDYQALPYALIRIKEATDNDEIMKYRSHLRDIKSGKAATTSSPFVTYSSKLSHYYRDRSDEESKSSAGDHPETIVTSYQDHKAHAESMRNAQSSAAPPGGRVTTSVTDANVVPGECQLA